MGGQLRGDMGGVRRGVGARTVEFERMGQVGMGGATVGRLHHAGHDEMRKGQAVILPAYLDDSGNQPLLCSHIQSRPQNF